MKKLADPSQEGKQSPGSRRFMDNACGTAGTPWATIGMKLKRYPTESTEPLRLKAIVASSKIIASRRTDQPTTRTHRQ
jgi:hypothetical protein